MLQSVRCFTAHLCAPHHVLCYVLGSNWREVEAALDRLVSQEREVATGDSQKGIHNGSDCSVLCVSEIAWGV